MLCKMYRPQKELKDIITFLHFLANIYGAAFVFKTCFQWSFRKGRLHPCLRRGCSHGGHSDAQRKTVSKNGVGGGRLLAMQGAGWVWTARSTLGSEIHREGHEYSSGNTSLTQPPPLRGADAHTRCSAVTERKPYGSLRVTDLPKAIKKKGVIFHFFFCQDQVSALFCSEACHF